MFLYIELAPGWHSRSVHSFGEPASERWLYLCSSLSKYRVRSGSFQSAKTESGSLFQLPRKPFVVAYQVTTVKLISGIANMPEEKMSESAREVPSTLWPRMAQGESQLRCPQFPFRIQRKCQSKHTVDRLK
jgi:hypothetical protein